MGRGQRGSGDGIPPGADHPESTAGSAAATVSVPAEKRGRHGSRLSLRAKQALQILVSLVLLVAIFWYVLGQFANLSEVWEAMRTLTWSELGLLAVATLWNLLTYWIVVVIATPGLTLPQAAVLTQSTTAVANSVPAGGAVAVGLTYTILSSWGFSRSRSTLSVIVSGIWNNFVKLGMPILALALLALQGERSGGRTLAAIAGLGGLVGAILVFAFILKSEDFARRAGLAGQRWTSSLLKVVGRPGVTGWDIAITKWRSRVIGLVKHRWLALTVSTVVSHLSLFAVLLLSLRLLGVSESEAGWAQALAVFAFARLLTAIPLTPGGVGVVELALIAGLSGGTAEDGQVVAAVLMFRLLTYVMPILIGGMTYVVWRRKRSWRDSAAPLTATGTIAAGHE
ncbi:MAG TPA: YbhN family protein [Actinomycetota bacterium]|nr:YbhN family protein [Actinomycetota bacterium]